MYNDNDKCGGDYGDANAISGRGVVVSRHQIEFE